MDLRAEPDDGTPSARPVCEGLAADDDRPRDVVDGKRCADEFDGGAAADSAADTFGDAAFGSVGGTTALLCGENSVGPCAAINSDKMNDAASAGFAGRTGVMHRFSLEVED